MPRFSSITTIADFSLLRSHRTCRDSERARTAGKFNGRLSLKPIYIRFIRTRRSRADHRLHRPNESQRRRHHPEWPGALAGNRRPRRSGADLQQYADGPAREIQSDVRPGRPQNVRAHRGAARAWLQHRHHARSAPAGDGGKTLAAKAKRGAIVIVDPNTGDILAMASWPTFDPNEFVPSISAAQFKELQNDPQHPSPSARLSFRISPGFHLQGHGWPGRLRERHDHPPRTSIECVPAMDVGNTTFHNWKKVTAARSTLSRR